mmetsp:Transcript_47484/g.55469  ORF Transcript_47484/g.55469 Transcript_47484/m.55469 type:complete len:102 (+) Transcript_47484:1007-1312(+)
MPTVSLATTNRSPHSGTVGGGDDVKAAILAMAMMAQATETRLKYSMEKQLSMMERRFTLRFDQLDKQLKQLTLLQASATHLPRSFWKSLVEKLISLYFCNR